MPASTSGALNGEWQPVESSWVEAARYDRGAGILWIQTKQGRVYPWVQNCDAVKARGFFRAQSKGRWIWRWSPPAGLRSSQPGSRTHRQRVRHRGKKRGR